MHALFSGHFSIGLVLNRDSERDEFDSVRWLGIGETTE